VVEKSTETSQKFCQIIPKADLKGNRSDGSDNKPASGSPGLSNNDGRLGGVYAKNHGNRISEPTPKVKPRLVRDILEKLQTRKLDMIFKKSARNRQMQVAHTT